MIENFVQTPHIDGEEIIDEIEVANVKVFDDVLQFIGDVFGVTLAVGATDNAFEAEGTIVGAPPAAEHREHGLAVRGVKWILVEIEEMAGGIRQGVEVLD